MLTAQRETHQTDAFGAYKLYLALRLHFSSDSYDAVKYNFKTAGGDYEKFRHKPEAYWFDRLSKKYSKEELINVFLSQFLAGKKWGGLHTGNVEFEETYGAWRARVESLSYNFEQDLSKLHQMLEAGTDEPIVLADLFHVVPSSYPWVAIRYSKKDISLESLTILDTLTGFVLKCEGRVTEGILWPTIKRSIKKYEPFLHFDREKFKTILLTHFPVR